MPFGVCDRCSSSDSVELFYHFEPWETEFLCWPCRKPLLYERVYPETKPARNGGRVSGQASLFDY